MADPMALLVAVAAAQAVEFVGLPEAQLNLAQAVVHLATAPKSNRAALGIWKPASDVREGAAARCPAHLRDSHYQGAAALGHGKGYEYPHDDPAGLAAPAVPARRAWSAVATTSPSTHGVRGRRSATAPRRERRTGRQEDGDGRRRRRGTVAGDVAAAPSSSGRCCARSASRP